MRWKIGNLYAKLFGWSFLAPFHHALSNLSLHALGYGNLLFNSSGEEWFIANKLAPSKPVTVIDVGANVGNYTNSILRDTGASVIAVEPNPHAFKKLSNNISSERVTHLQCALSNQPGTAKLYFQSELDEKASLEVVNPTEQQAVEVPVRTLEQIATENNLLNIDFVKIDTEGFEKEVIEGMGKLRPKYIQFEFNVNHLQRNTTLLEITELLPGYTFYRLLPHGWLEVNPKKYLNNIFMFSNYVAVLNTKATE